MNKKDLKIIAHLRQDGRMQLTKMSKKTGIPVSTIFDRIKKENNAIKKHTCLLDFNKLGYNIRANIALRVNKEDKQNLKEFLVRNNKTNSVYKINNGYDFMLEGIFENIKEMDEFIENIEERFTIEDKKSFFLIEDLKKEGFLSNADLVF